MEISEALAIEICESKESLREKLSSMEVSEASAMEISGKSTTGYGHGGPGDRWWIRHGF